MFYNLKIIICGNRDSLNNSEWCLPVTNSIICDPEEVKKRVGNRSSTSLGHSPNIIGIFICGKQFPSLTNNRPNVFHLPRRRVTFFTTLYAIRTCQLKSEHLFASNDPKSTIVWGKRGTDLKRWLTTNNKVEGCDILISSINTTNETLRLFQQALIELCEDLINDYEIRVCTVDDYISLEEPYANMSKEEQDFIDEQNRMVCTLLLPNLASIRMCLVGNDEGQSNEQDDGSENGSQYYEQCTVVEYEPVTPASLEKLASHGGRLRRVQNMKLVELDHIRAHSHFFLHALDRGRCNLEAREMVANAMLSNWTMKYYENSIEYSMEFYETAEAQSNCSRQNDDLTSTLNDMIQSPLRTSEQI